MRAHAGPCSRMGRSVRSTHLRVAGADRLEPQDFHLRHAQPVGALDLGNVLEELRGAPGVGAGRVVGIIRERRG